jgi:two-component system, response regulator PdtaR
MNVAAKPMIVLVVEDEVLVNLNIAEALRDDGLRTVQAYTGEEALNVLSARGDISLVFTDVNLPGKIDGIALASEIQLRWPEIEVLTTSARKLPRFDEGELVKLHDRFVPKPYWAEAVARRIRNIICANAPSLEGPCVTRSPL